MLPLVLTAWIEDFGQHSPITNLQFGIYIYIYLYIKELRATEFNLPESFLQYDQHFSWQLAKILEYHEQHL